MNAVGVRGTQSAAQKARHTRSSFAQKRLAPLPLLILCLTILAACAAADRTGKKEKIGMHIDAELEFAVSYPLEWLKERRVPWRSPAGSVVWLLPGLKSNGSFEITSLVLEPSPQPLEERFVLLRDRHPGLTLSAQQQRELPAGKVLHAEGSSPKATVAAYLLRGPTRDYLLVLSTPPDNFARFASTVEELLPSFQILPARP